jgi:protein kinase A
MATYERILDAKTVFPSHVDPYAKSFIRGLLTPDLSCRLGNLAGGAKDVMEHTFFAGRSTRLGSCTFTVLMFVCLTGVDWDILEQRKIPPPIIPSVTSKGTGRPFLFPIPLAS